MKLYYHKTDGGAEYYCTEHIEDSDEGDMKTVILRADGHEIEFYASKLALLGVDVIIRS